MRKYPQSTSIVRTQLKTQKEKEKEKQSEEEEEEEEEIEEGEEQEKPIIEPKLKFSKPTTTASFTKSATSKIQTGSLMNRRMGGQKKEGEEKVSLLSKKSGEKGGVVVKNILSENKSMNMNKESGNIKDIENKFLNNKTKLYKYNRGEGKTPEKDKDNENKDSESKSSQSGNKGIKEEDIKKENENKNSSSKTPLRYRGRATEKEKGDNLADVISTSVNDILKSEDKKKTDLNLNEQEEEEIKETDNSKLDEKKKNYVSDDVLKRNGIEIVKIPIDEQNKKLEQNKKNKKRSFTPEAKNKNKFKSKRYGSVEKDYYSKKSYVDDDYMRKSNYSKKFNSYYNSNTYNDYRAGYRRINDRKRGAPFPYRERTIPQRGRPNETYKGNRSGYSDNNYNYNRSYIREERYNRSPIRGASNFARNRGRGRPNKIGVTRGSRGTRGGPFRTRRGRY